MSKCDNCTHEPVCRYRDNMKQFEEKQKELTHLMEFGHFSVDIRCKSFTSENTKEEGITIPSFLRPIGD